MKVLCQLRGREIEFKAMAVDMFQRFADALKDDGIVDSRPSLEGPPPPCPAQRSNPNPNLSLKHCNPRPSAMGSDPNPRHDP